MKMKISLLVVAGLAGASSLSAQVIYSTDYDVNNGYSQNDSNTGTGSVFTFNDDANTDGVGGGDALSIRFDASAVDITDDYNINTFTNQVATGTAATSTNFADYDLSFDINSLGLSGASNTILMDVKFSGAPSVNEISVAITDTYQNLTFNLGTIGYAGTLAQINDGLQLKFYTYNNAAGKFGRDADNGVFVDNITVTQVPEPSTFAALAGLAALGFVMVRRRRS